MLHENKMQANCTQTSSCCHQHGIQEGQGGDYAIATAIHRDDTTSLRVCRVETFSDSVGKVLTMRAVFPLTPNEDLKAGQYWFANRTSDPDVAPAQADDLAPAQIASVTQSVCIFFLSVAAASFFWAIPVCALPNPTLSGAVEYCGMLTSGEGEYAPSSSQPGTERF